MSLTDPLALINDFKKSNLCDRTIFALIFLMPILSMSVRHWLSGIFSLLALLSFYYLFTQRKFLHKEERFLLYIFAAFLFSFILSATLNDWTPNSLRRTGTEFKYLLFFPLYIMLRKYVNLRDMLLYGVIIGGIILGLQGIYDTYFHPIHRAKGIYGSITFGDLAVLFFSITTLLALYEKQNKLKIYILTSSILSALAVYLSGTRNAWLAFLISFILIVVLSKPKENYQYLIKTFSIIIIFTVIFAALISTTSESRIFSRATTAINEINDYSGDKSAENLPPLKRTSIRFRLEKWKVALRIFTEAPWFGYGAGNVGIHINSYVREGKAHPDLYDLPSETGIGDTWSTYVDSLVHEGSVGFIMFLLFLLYPMYIWLKLRKYNYLTSSIGILFTLNFMMFGVSENPFISDNATSVYLIFLSVLFSSLINAKYSIIKSN